MNINKLRGKIVENCLGMDQVANILGVNRATLYRKLNNFEKLTIGDAKKLKLELDLSDEDACEIFLS